MDLQSERDCLQATVESRNQQVKTMNDEERLRSDTIQALEQEDCVKKELLANTERLKSPLVSDLSRMKQELSESVARTGICRAYPQELPCECHVDSWLTHKQWQKCSAVRLSRH